MTLGHNKLKYNNQTYKQFNDSRAMLNAEIPSAA